MVGSFQSASGVTTCALLVGYRDAATVVEADASGGDVAAWLGCPDTGLSELATVVVRSGQLRAEQLRQYATTTRFEVAVVTAPLLPEGAAASVAELGEALPKLATETDLVVDVGRIDAASATPAARLLAHADEVLLLVVPTVAGLARLRGRLPGLRQACGERLKLVVSRLPGGPPRYPDVEVAQVSGWQVAGVLPYDPGCAAVVAGMPGRLPPRAGRLRWWRRWRHPMWEAVSRL